MAISSPALYLPSTPKLSPSISLSSSTSSFISPASKFFRPGNVGNRVALTRALPGNGRRKRFSCTCLFGLGVPELAVIAGVAALVFGPKKLPEIGRSIGKTVKSFQQAAQEFESELKKEPESLDEATGTRKSTAAREGEKNETSTPVSTTKDSL